MAVSLFLFGLSIACLAQDMKVTFKFPEGWSGKPDAKEAQRLYDEAMQILVTEDNVHHACEILGRSIDADPFGSPGMPYLLSFCNGHDHSGKLSDFRRQMRRKLTSISSAYSGNSDFEYMTIMVNSVDNSNLRGRDLKDFIAKHPEHKGAALSLSENYFYWENNISNIELGRTILRRILHKDRSWAAGWNEIGNTYTYHVHKDFEAPSKAETCLRLSVLLGADIDFRMDKFAGDDCPELAANILREYWRKYRFIMHAGCRYGDGLKYTIFSLWDKKYNADALQYLGELDNLLDQPFGFCDREPMKKSWVAGKTEDIRSGKPYKPDNKKGK